MARDGHNGDTTIYNDNGRSGDRAKLGKRTGWAQMLEAIERGEVSAVYVRVLDRTGRSLEEFLRFLRVCRENRVRLVDQTGDRTDPDREDSATFEMWAAEKELKRAKERSAYTLRMQRARGDAIGHAPYGFKLEREPETGRIIRVPNPGEPLEPVLAAVRETRGNILAACKLLNSLGVSTRFGNPWSTRTLTRAVREFEPRLLRTRAPSIMAKGGLRPPAPLARLVLCHCGHVMTSNMRNKELVCGAGHKVGAAVHGRYVGRDRFVYDALRTEAARTFVVRFDRKAKEGIPEKRKALEAAMARLDAKLDVGRVDPASYREQIKKIQMELDGLIEEDGQDEFSGATRQPLIDWEAAPEALGDQLRRYFRSVQLDENMLPVAVHRR